MGLPWDFYATSEPPIYIFFYAVMQFCNSAKAENEHFFAKNARFSLAIAK